MQSHDKFARPELMIDWFEVEGPVYESWPPPPHRAILGDGPKPNEAEPAYARRVVERFMERAFRRRLPRTRSTPSSNSTRRFVARNRSSKRSRCRWWRLLHHPIFCFCGDRRLGHGVDKAPRSEIFAEQPQGHRGEVQQVGFVGHRRRKARAARILGGYELASRLSYFLWSAPPDDELLELAKSGKLSDSLVREEQVDRMLKNPKSDALVTNFVGQWLNLRDVGANPPAEDLYPQYDRTWKPRWCENLRAFSASFSTTTLTPAK